MSNMRFTNDHEWARLEDLLVTVGITNYAQDQLGELVYVELPTVGTVVNQGDESAIIESVKAAGDVKSPVTGTIVEVNESLNDSPESVNDDATGQGWFYKIEIADTSELENLLSETNYNALIAELS